MTFTVYNKGAWRYYSVDGKEIISIAFYDDKGVVVQTDRGWLERGEPGISRTVDVTELVFEKEIVRKTKLNFPKSFEEKQVFIIKSKLYTTEGTFLNSGYFLFIPYIREEWTVTPIFKDVGTVRNEYTTYYHNTEHWIINKYQGYKPILDNVVFVNRMSELYDLCGTSDANEISIIQNRDKIIDFIKSFYSELTTPKVSADELEIL